MLRAALRQQSSSFAEAALGLGAVVLAACVGYQLGDAGLVVAALPVLALFGLLAVASRTELSFGIAIAVALVAIYFLPQTGLRVWYLAILVVFGAAAIRLAAGPQKVRLPSLWLWPLGVFGAVYVITALHGEWTPVTVSNLARVLFPALLALAAAWMLDDPRKRRNVVVMLVAAGLFELVVAGTQAVRVLGAGGSPDLVTGTFGADKHTTIAVFNLACATIVLAFALQRVWRPRLLAILALLLAATGVLSGARALLFLVPIAFGVTILIDLLSRSTRLPRGWGLIALGVAVISGPLLVLASSSTYSQSTDRVGSPTAIVEYLTEDASGRAPRQGAQLIGSIEGLGDRGVGDKLMGRGVGTTSFDADPHVVARPGASSAPLFLRPEVDFGTVWLPRLITESGLIGLAAFIGLLIWAAYVALRARGRLQPGSVDSAIVLAMPGLCGLVLIASTYEDSILSPGLSTLFWIMLGMCLRIGADAGKPQPEKYATARQA